jgi:MYXO-CTERM domain-containing protein
VVMVSEDIRLTLEPKAGQRTQWHVEAHYVFKNTGAAKVALQFGFPEYRCETTEPEAIEFCPSPKDFRFKDMKTLVRGEAVPHRKGKLDKGHDWAPLLGTVWLFDVALEPGEEVPVDHDYRVPSTYDSTGGQGVTYVTRTGAMWGKPIGRARFTFRYPPRVCALYPPSEADGQTALVPFAEFRLVEEKGELVAEAVYETRDWTPPADVEFYAQPCVIAADYWDRDHPKLCPGHEALSRYAYGRTNAHDDVPPPSHDEVLHQLAALSQDQLRLCKNYPFASYGRPFADAALAQAFYGAAKPEPSKGPLKPFEASAHYTDALLTQQDWRWVRIVEEAIALSPAPAAKVAPPSPTDVATANPAPEAVPGAPPPAGRAGCSGCSVASGGATWQGWLALLALSLAVSPRRRRPSRQPARCRQP